MGPQTFADLGWWILGGAIFVSVAACALLLKLLLAKLKEICKLLSDFQKIMSKHDKAIVELQTRCAMNHRAPLANKIQGDEE
jgi:hypothetical protein